MAHSVVLVVCDYLTPFARILLVFIVLLSVGVLLN